MAWQPGISLEQMEKETILEAYRFYRGNKTSTAAALGIAIRTLDSRLEKYGVTAYAEINHDDEVEPMPTREEAYAAAAARAEARRQTAVQARERAENQDQAVRAQAGGNVEPALENTEKRHLSVRKREKVQEVSSK